MAGYGKQVLVRNAFLWLMSVIYLFAFSSLYVQIPGKSTNLSHCCVSLSWKLNLLIIPCIATLTKQKVFMDKMVFFQRSLPLEKVRYLATLQFPLSIALVI